MALRLTAEGKVGPMKKTPGRCMGFRFVGLLSGPEVEEVNIAWFQLLWLNTSSDPQKENPENDISTPNLGRARNVFLVQLEGVTWFAAHDSGLSPANLWH